MKITRQKVLAISGSTRAHSSNEAILRVIARLLAPDIDIEFYQGLTRLPYFNPDVPEEDITPEVQEFRALVAAADGVIICTPEYVFSLPGALKNALEWAVSTTVFAAKPVAVITASAVGEKGHASLLLIMETLAASLSEETNLLISGVRSKINKEGESIDPVLAQALEKLGRVFIQRLAEAPAAKV